jgi:hypothetical protein
MSLAESLAALIERGERESSETAESIVRFLLSEVARRPDDRGLLFIAPGSGLFAAMEDGLQVLAGVSACAEVVVISERPQPKDLSPTVVWLNPPPGPPLAPFLVRYSDAAGYALVRAEKVSGQGARLFHTNDRSVVEYLAFQLQRELALPELA